MGGFVCVTRKEQSRQDRRAMVGDAEAVASETCMFSEYPWLEDERCQNIRCTVRCLYELTTSPKAHGCSQSDREDDGSRRV